MTYISISSSLRSAVIALNIITLSFINVCVFSNFYNLRRKAHVIVSSILLVITLMQSTVLIGLNHSIEHFRNFNVLPFSLPFYLHMIYCVLVVIFAIYSMYTLQRDTKNLFSALTIKKVVDDFPTGICFYDDKGTIHLANRLAFELSLILTGMDLQNGLEFEKSLDQLKSNKVISGENSAFMLNDRRVFQMTKAVDQSQGLSSILFHDISHYYHLSDHVRESNEKLKHEQKILIEHIKNITQETAYKENQRIKMLIHDDFGELIALTVKAFDNGACKEEKIKVLSLWDKLNEKMQKMNDMYSSIEDSKYNMEKVQELSSSLDCKLIITGQIPNIYDNVVYHGIYESLKNAAYHTKAKELRVVIQQVNEDITVSISNKNTNKLKNVVFGTGLHALKERVEKSQGTMDFTCGEDIVLTMTFKINENNTGGENV